ncbi:hypothetical protein D3C84_971820 [compost metagenome]
MTTAKRNLTTPRQPVRREMEYQNATPDGRTLLESIKTVQHATLAELRTIIEEARNIVSSVRWRVTPDGASEATTVRSCSRRMWHECS